jgi:hypothetical protein
MRTLKRFFTCMRINMDSKRGWPGKGLYAMVAVVSVVTFLGLLRLGILALLEYGKA